MQVVPGTCIISLHSVHGARDISYHLWVVASKRGCLARLIARWSGLAPAVRFERGMHVLRLYCDDRDHVPDRRRSSLDDP